jgi:hypothetical protein
MDNGDKGRWRVERARKRPVPLALNFHAGGVPHRRFEPGVSAETHIHRNSLNAPQATDL